MRPLKAVAGPVALFLVCSVSQLAAAAPVAKVAAKERDVEKKAGETASWEKAKVGTQLDDDNRFRTRKRSKADILFIDKSLIRLGQLSTLHVQSATESKLTQGELLFSRLTPGRIVAGAGIAGIKGSVGVIHLNEDGSTLFSLFSGAMDVETIRGDRVAVAPGQAVLVYADGSLSALKVAAPLISSGTGRGFGTGSGGGGGLGESPVDSPYAGSNANVTARSSPSRLSGDQGNTAGSSIIAQNANPFQPAVPPVVGGPLPPDPPIGIFPRFLLAPGGAVPVAPAPAVPAVEMTQTLSELDSQLALAHLGEAEGGSGYTGVADVEMIGALSDGGTYAYGGQLHSFLNKGPWSVDMALLPLKLHYNTPAGRVSRDISAVSSGSVTYSSPRFDVQVGRQRFLAGPTQAALFGSLVRQGARDVMDAVRVAPNIGKGRSLDLAYLVDAFPQNLPYRVPGHQTGYYGRYGMETRRFNIGVNLLHYNNLPVSTTTGASLDFAVPVLSGDVEVYGELGRDPYRRGINTFGLTFPGLYQSTDFDVYVEAATMTKGSSTAPIPPTEYSMRVYKKLNKNSNLVVQLQRFHRTQSSITIGLSFGAHIPLRGD